MVLLALSRSLKLPVQLELVSPGMTADCSDVNVTDISSQRSICFELRNSGSVPVSLPYCPLAGAEIHQGTSNWSRDPLHHLETCGLEAGLYLYFPVSPTIMKQCYFSKTLKNKSMHTWTGRMNMFPLMLSF